MRYRAEICDAERISPRGFARKSDLHSRAWKRNLLRDQRKQTGFSQRDFADRQQSFRRELSARSPVISFAPEKRAPSLRLMSENSR